MSLARNLANLVRGLFVDSSGNVGIGTSSVYEKLQISGNILVADGTNANYIEVRNASNWTGRLAASAIGKFSMQYYNGSAWTNGITLDSSGNLQMNSGYGSVAAAYGCRAWVNFNGTGTVAIRASGNVSSITDNGVGDYTVNFTNAMPDTNYATVVGGNTMSGASQVVMAALYQYNTSTSGATASSIRVNAATTGGGGGNADLPFFNAAIFR